MKFKQFLQVSNGFDDPRFHPLSDKSLLLYGRFYSLTDFKNGKPAFASNEYIMKATGWSERTVTRHREELENWNLITVSYKKHGLTKTTRYVMPLPLEGASNPKQLTPVSTEEQTNTVAAVDINVEAVDTSVRSSRHPVQKQWTPESTIIDNTINNKIDNIIDKVIATLFDVDEDLLFDIKSYWRKGTIDEESLNTLSPVEQNKLHDLIKERFKDKHKPPINIVIESKLWKGNAYNKWIEENNQNHLLHHTKLC